MPDHIEWNPQISTHALLKLVKRCKGKENVTDLRNVVVQREVVV